MKTLIAYYSFTGNNKILAENLAARMSADTFQIMETRRRTLATFLLDLLLNRRPRIIQSVIAWDKYDQVILIAPVWNAAIASPMCTFIRNEKQHLNGYAVVSVCGGRPGQAARIRKQLTRLAGKPPLTIIELPIKDRLPVERRKAEEKTGTVRIKTPDLQYFAADMAKILEVVEAPKVPA